MKKHGWLVMSVPMYIGMVMIALVLLGATGCKVSGGREFEMEIFGSKFAIHDRALPNQQGELEYLNTFDDDSNIVQSIFGWLLTPKETE